MPAYVWIALGVFFVCLLAGTIWAMVNGLRARRQARPAVRRMNAESAALIERSTALERRLAALEPKTAELQRERARLARSVMRARMLLGAVGEATAIVRVARLFVP